MRNVSVLLGDGAGGFATASGSPFAVGDMLHSLAAGDLNSDEERNEMRSSATVVNRRGAMHELSDAQLLTRHLPVLRYDSLECYFADSAAEWTDHAGNTLKDAAGDVLAAAAGAGGAAVLSLDLLGPAYGADKKAADTDLISDPTREYREQARELHANPKYGNRVYGRVKPEGEYRWVQYWFFYYYNDYNLIGPFIGAGRHEGDWEMIQIGVDAAGDAAVAVYAQHDHAGSYDWDQVDLEPGTQQPIVYVARGSHASYFEPGYFHWTGVWWDHADGKRRRSPELELEKIDEADPTWDWVSWPGHWGDTKKGSLPFDADSPKGPGHHGAWNHPSGLLERAAAQAATPPPARPARPAPPQVVVKRTEQGIALDYSLPNLDGHEPAGLVVAVNSPDDKRVPPTTYQLEISGAKGTVEVPEPASPEKRYDLYVSLATKEGVASEAIRRDLRPAKGPSH